MPETNLVLLYTIRHGGHWLLWIATFQMRLLVTVASALQLVDRLDYGAFSTSAAGTMSYQGLYKLVSKALYRTHVEGKLKREIIQVRSVAVWVIVFHDLCVLAYCHCTHLEASCWVVNSL